MTVFNPLSLKKAHACRWSVDSRWGANCKAFLHELAWPNHPNPGTATQYYAELRSTTQYYAVLCPANIETVEFTANIFEYSL